MPINGELTLRLSWEVLDALESAGARVGIKRGTMARMILMEWLQSKGHLTTDDKVPTDLEERAAARRQRRQGKTVSQKLRLRG